MGTENKHSRRATSGGVGLFLHVPSFSKLVSVNKDMLMSLIYFNLQKDLYYSTVFPQM